MPSEDQHAQTGIRSGAQRPLRFGLMMAKQDAKSYQIYPKKTSRKALVSQIGARGSANCVARVPKEADGPSNRPARVPESKIDTKRRPVAICVKLPEMH